MCTVILPFTMLLSWAACLILSSIACTSARSEQPENAIACRLFYRLFGRGAALLMWFDIVSVLICFVCSLKSSVRLFILIPNTNAAQTERTIKIHLQVFFIVLIAPLIVSLYGQAVFLFVLIQHIASRAAKCCRLPKLGYLRFAFHLRQQSREYQ